MRNALLVEATNLRRALPLLGLLALPGPAALAQAPSLVLQPHSPSVGAGGTPYQVVLADVNGDGHLDALTANEETSTVGVLLGDGQGGFVLHDTPTTGERTFPGSLAVADVNGDGHPDVLTTSTATSAVDVLLGDGKGNFAVFASEPAGELPMNIRVADVNGDHYPDAVISNFYSASVRVLLGNGAGHFALQTQATVVGPDSHPIALALADLNADGYLDVVTANTNSTVAVLAGDGRGHFAPGVLHPTSALLSSLAVADVNGDGHPDALAASYSASTLDVLLGDGHGSLALVGTYPAGSGSDGVAVADLNDDGYADAATADYDGSTLSVLLGDGRGHFAPPAAAPSTGPDTHPDCVVLADVNGDNRPDALTANNGSSTLSVLLNYATALPTRAALPGAAVRLYPNPARATATLALAGLPATATQVQATLLDATGRVVSRHTLPGMGGGAVPLAGLRPGLYVVRLVVLDAREQALGELPAQRLAVE